MPFALALILLSAGWRVVAAHIPDLANFAPVMALTFCGAVYFRDKRLWLVPFAALLLSDLYLDHYYEVKYHEQWIWPSVLIRVACFAMAIPIGQLVAQRKTWLNLFTGALGGAVLFYVVTNTDAWLRDPAYVKTVGGWWQSLTVGRPEFPPTLFFFRNSLVSDLFFTALFVAVMEFAALRAGAASLLGRRANA